MKFLVVPSNRPDNLAAFLKTWEGRGGWDRVVVVEDGPRRTPGIAADYHYSWAEIDIILGADASIISREDSAIRSFGFLAAWHLGADAVLTLDDDCFPREGTTDLFAEHLRTMMRHTVWIPSVPGQRTRGLPYKNLGTLHSSINVGLWSGIGDWDSVQDVPSGRFEPPPGSRIVPHNQLVPMCGMNLCFTRHAIPLMYFPPMGRGQPYRRFDDIWCGVVAKFLMDRLGWRMSVGEPFVEHTRASDPEVNRVKEAPGIEANEEFWQCIASALGSLVLEGDTMAAIMRLGSVLAKDSNSYISNLGYSLMRWSLLCNCNTLEF